MVLCPRCNKNLSTNQALTYHLNRRIPCNSIRCLYCNQTFATKLELQMHSMRCSRVDNIVPETSVLYDMFCHSPYGILVVAHDRVRYHSPNLTNVRTDDPFDLASWKESIYATTARPDYTIHYVRPKNEPCSNWSSPRV